MTLLPIGHLDFPEFVNIQASIMLPMKPLLCKIRLQSVLYPALQLGSCSRSGSLAHGAWASLKKMYHDDVYEYAFDNHYLITVEEVRALGVPGVELSKLAQRGRLENILRGLYPDFQGVVVAEWDGLEGRLAPQDKLRGVLDHFRISYEE